MSSGKYIITGIYSRITEASSNCPELHNFRSVLLHRHHTPLSPFFSQTIFQGVGIPQLGYGLDGRGWISGRVMTFLYFTASRLFLGSNQPPLQWLCITKDSPLSDTSASLQFIFYIYLFSFSSCLCGAKNIFKLRLVSVILLSIEVFFYPSCLYIYPGRQHVYSILYFHLPFSLVTIICFLFRV
jgi:hypothetical protein